MQDALAVYIFGVATTSESVKDVTDRVKEENLLAHHPIAQIIILEIPGI